MGPAQHTWGHIPGASPEESSVRTSALEGQRPVRRLRERSEKRFRFWVLSTKVMHVQAGTTLAAGHFVLAEPRAIPLPAGADRERLRPEVSQQQLHLGPSLLPRREAPAGRGWVVFLALPSSRGYPQDFQCHGHSSPTAQAELLWQRCLASGRGARKEQKSRAQPRILLLQRPRTGHQVLTLCTECPPAHAGQHGAALWLLGKVLRKPLLT